MSGVILFIFSAPGVPVWIVLKAGLCWQVADALPRLSSVSQMAFGIVRFALHRYGSNSSSERLRRS